MEKEIEKYIKILNETNRIKEEIKELEYKIKGRPKTKNSEGIMGLNDYKKEIDLKFQQHLVEEKKDRVELGNNLIWVIDEKKKIDAKGFVSQIEAAHQDNDELKTIGEKYKTYTRTPYVKAVKKLFEDSDHIKALLKQAENDNNSPTEVFKIINLANK